MWQLEDLNVSLILTKGAVVGHTTSRVDESLVSSIIYDQLYYSLILATVAREQ